MPRTRTLTGFTTLTLALACSSQGLAQSEQDNVFDAGGGNTGNYDFVVGDPATNTNWSEGGPATWDSNEVEAGISFDVGENGTYTINVDESFTAIDDINILSLSIIELVGTGSESFTITGGSDLTTGDGAMSITGLNLNLEGNMTFDYGNGLEADDDDAPLSILSTEYDISYNLIINGLISNTIDSSSSTMTFQGGGYALLTGGVTTTTSGFGMNLVNSSLLLGAIGANAEYQFFEGVTVSYNGTLEGRENGHGILQVAGAGAAESTLDTGDENIAMSGFASLLVGSIDLTDSVLEDLGFGEGDYVVENAGTGAVSTTNLILDNDSVVVIGNNSGITGESDNDDAALQMNGNSNFIVQAGGTVSFDELELSSGFISTAGSMSFDELSTSATIDILFGGSVSSTGDASFNGSSTTNVDGGNLAAATATDSGLNVDIDGDIFVTNGGSFNAGAASAAVNEEATINLDGTVVLDAATAIFAGDFTANGALYALNGSTFTYTPGDNAAGDEILNLANATIGGGSLLDDNGISTIDLSLYNNIDPDAALTIGTLFGGYYDSTDGSLNAGYGTLALDLGGNNLSDFSGNLLFGIGFDEDSMTGYNTLIDLIGGTLEATEETTLDLVISGDSYLPTGTIWSLFNTDDIVGDWQDIVVNGTNSVTRTFSTDGLNDGEVAILADYNAPAAGGNGVVTGNGQWLQDQSDMVNTPGQENQVLQDLLLGIDEIGTTEQYQKALTALSPNTLASGLQIVADPASFTAYSEALSEMRNANELGRPGPARRPLGQESQSLFAAQDEADAVRSQYGYGAGPESGQRRMDDDNAIAFIQGYGRSLDLQNTGEIIGLSANQWGVLAGFGRQVADNSVLGLLVGYDDFSGDLNDGYGDVKVSTIRVGPFFGWSDGTWNVDLALTGAFNDWSGMRNTFTAPNDRYDWDTDGWQIDFSANVGYRIPLGGGLNIVPEASFIYSYIQTEGYTESGGPAASTISADDFNGFIGRLGGNLELLSFSGLIIEGSLGWQGNFGTGGDVETSVGGSSGITSPEYANRNNVYYGAQFTWMPTWDVALTFRYEGRTGDGTDDQYFGGGVSFEF